MRALESYPTGRYARYGIERPSAALMKVRDSTREGATAAPGAWSWIRMIGAAGTTAVAFRAGVDAASRIPTAASAVSVPLGIPTKVHRAREGGAAGQLQ